MIRALLFDFDGLILDTETPEYEAWRELFVEHGCELPLGAWCDCVGRPATHFDPHAELERLSGRALDRETIRHRRRARFAELIAERAVLPGVESLLAEAASRGILAAVVSSSPRAWVESHLDRLGLRHRFATLVCREDTQKHKPGPEPYLEAMRRLGVAAAEVVAFEDSAHGVTAAKAAGAFTIAVPNPITRGLDLSHADVCCASLAEMSLELIERAALKPRTAILHRP